MQRHLASSFVLTPVVAMLVLSGCMTSAAIQQRARVVTSDVEKARKSGAYRCSPEALANAEAHLAFTELELQQGDFIRAGRHVNIAMRNVKQALAESKDCGPKRVLIKKPKPVVIEKTDRDGDGITDDVDQCPDDPEDPDGFEDEDGCPDADNDQDGVFDVEDVCPNTPGPVENSGCPVEDRDGDGILDGVDQCPDAPEDKDGFEDEDGCPDPDNDKDGILDGVDQCPVDPEDTDGFEDQDGCPDPDNDKDGILDTMDECPNDPGPAETNGCPKKYSLIVVKKDKIEIKQKVHFATAKARILPDSFELLAQVADAIKTNQLQKVLIEGHTDSRGSDSYNMGLSQRRADSVRQHLIDRGGVSPSVVESVGFGETRPIASNNSREGRAENRRVEFKIVER